MTQSKFIKLINNACDSLGNIDIFIFEDYWKRMTNILNKTSKDSVVRSSLNLETIKDLANRGEITPVTTFANSYPARKMVMELMTAKHPIILSCEYDDSKKEYEEVLAKILEEEKQQTE